MTQFYQKILMMKKVIINREILSLGQFGGDKFKVEGENVFPLRRKSGIGRNW